MNYVFNALLILHILGGSVALICGYGALWVKRGGARHRVLGVWYVRAMGLVVVTGLPMSIIHPNIFLFGIVFFTAYLVLSGQRAAVVRADLPQPTDIVLAWGITGLSISAIVLILAAFIAEAGVSPTILITGGVFSLIGLARGIGDMVEFRRGTITGKVRIRRHLSCMCAALIATTTAVAVTMVSYLPEIPAIIAWLGPSVILSPLIGIWSRQIMQGKYQY